MRKSCEIAILQDELEALHDYGSTLGLYSRPECYYQQMTIKFSEDLDKWLKGRNSKTIAGISRVFAEKSFAICFLVLMAIPALPLPTGGVTHVFEIINILLALELIVGRKEIWLPRKWRHKKLGSIMEKKTLPFLVRKIRWLEKYSRPRLSGLMRSRLSSSLIGLLVLIFTLAAFVSPPFSGLDTLPSLGVVLLALSLILEDFAILLIGLIVGLGGIALEIILGGTLVHGFKLLF